MYPKLTDDEKKALDERFLVYSEPEPLHLWEDSHCADLVRMIAQNNVNVVLLDSASVSFGEDLNNQAQVNKSLDNLDAIRVRLQVCFIIVAHTRKAPSGESTSVENVSINDLFGHSGIAQHASAIFLLYEDEKARRETIRKQSGEKDEKLVHIINVKTRFGSANAAFKSKLPSRESTAKGSPLQFYRNVTALPPLTPEQRAKIKSDGKHVAEDLGDVDFTALLEEGEDDDL